MRIECPHCQGKSVITSSHKLSDWTKDIYCQCLNTQNCGSSFVATVSIKHTLNPPIKTTLQLAASLIMTLPASDRKKLQMDVFG